MMEFLTITLPIMLTMIGGVYLIKADSNKFEKRMEKSDERWVILLNDMHRIDKDTHLLKNKSPKQ
jgi:hypothetical protein